MSPSRSFVYVTVEVVCLCHHCVEVVEALLCGEAFDLEGIEAAANLRQLRAPRRLPVNQVHL